MAKDCDQYYDMVTLITRENLKLKAPQFRFHSACEAERGKTYSLMDHEGDPMFVVFLGRGGRIIAGLEGPAVAPVGAAVACFYTVR